MTRGQFIAAARVPLSLPEQSFGLWTIHRKFFQPKSMDRAMVGWPHQTILSRITDGTMHLPPGEIVMEDSTRELSRHLPIWISAHGRVLVTGLGLGCVVRGLVAKPNVDHIDVVEIDASIIRVVGAEFAASDRVTIHHGDALAFEFPAESRWDFAWHDLWTNGGDHLQSLHTKLFCRFRRQVAHQGAWAFPPMLARLMPWRPLGAPNHKRLRRAA